MSQAAPRGRARGRGRGRGQAEQQERMEGGGHGLPANRLEDGHERVEGGHQLPAHRLDDEHATVEGRQQLPAHRQEEQQEVEEGGQELPVQEGQVREVRGLGEDEGEDITDRIRPVIPPPNPEAGRGLDIDGWAAIGRVGAWDAMLSEVNLLEAVPEQHKSVWVWAAAEVLRRLQSAGSEEETTQALMWWCFLPQALLRKPSRGGRAGRGIVATRFNTLGQERNWGKIVEMWEVDRERERRNREGRPKPRQEKEEDKKARLRREVVGLINGGKISKALQRVTSCGVASAEDPAVLAMLRAKYPARGRPLPERVVRGQCIDNLAGLRESILQLEPGISPGTGGMKAEFLIVLAQRLDDEEIGLLEDFGMRYLKGELPSWFYPVWLTVQTVPLFMSEQQNTLRPVGVRNPLLKVWHREVVLRTN